MEDGTPDAQTIASEVTSGVDESKAEGSHTSQPAEAKESGTAPWQKDLEGFGFDPDITNQFSEYLRTQWQPRMTQHEQDLAAWSKLFDGDLESAQIAAGFFGDLNKDPRATFARLEEVLRAGGHLDDALSDDNTQQEPVTDDNQEPDTPEELKWARQQMQREQEQADIKAYEEAVKAATSAKFGGEEINRALFDKLFIANNGNMEETLKDYEPLHKGAPPADPPPPGTAGGDAPPAPQQGKKIRTMDDALDSFFEEERARKSR